MRDMHQYNKGAPLLKAALSNVGSNRKLLLVNIAMKKRFQIAPGTLEGRLSSKAESLFARLMLKQTIERWNANSTLPRALRV